MISGGRVSIGDTRPNATTGTPSSRSLLRHNPSHATPRAVTASPQAGICGTANVAAGNAAVVRAIQSTTAAPQPIGTHANQSRPNGISARPINPAGITQNAVSGTATMFATMKYT